MAESQNVVHIERQEKVAVITLNRPDAMNAINFGMLDALTEAIDSVRFDPEIRVLIITGAGEKAFCAGADLKERHEMPEIRVKAFLHTLRRLYSDIEALSKPVISAVNGFALGGGMEMALATDIRIASMNASMGLTETRLAVIPGGGGTQRLPRIIGKAKAKELIFTGRRVDAREALDVGLVNQICEPHLLMDEAMIMAQMICEAGPIAIEQAKYAIDAGLETDLGTGLGIESNAYRVTIPTQDRLEGISAFLEKRKPVYTGR